MSDQTCLLPTDEPRDPRQHTGVLSGCLGIASCIFDDTRLINPILESSRAFKLNRRPVNTRPDMGWRGLLELPALLLVQMCREISDNPPVILEIQFTQPVGQRTDPLPTSRIVLLLGGCLQRHILWRFLLHIRIQLREHVPSIREPVRLVWKRNVALQE